MSNIRVLREQSSESAKAPWFRFARIWWAKLVGKKRSPGVLSEIREAPRKSGRHQ